MNWQVEMYQDKNFHPLQKLFREWNMKHTGKKVTYKSHVWLRPNIKKM